MYCIDLIQFDIGLPTRYGDTAYGIDAWFLSGLWYYLFFSQLVSILLVNTLLSSMLSMLRCQSIRLVNRSGLLCQLDRCDSDEASSTSR